MHGIIIRGLGKSKSLITRGYIGFIQKVIDAGRVVVKHGRSAYGKVEEELGEIFITVKLIAVNERYLRHPLVGSIRVKYNRIKENMSMISEHVNTKIKRRIDEIVINVISAWRRKK